MRTPLMFSVLSLSLTASAAASAQAGPGAPPAPGAGGPAAPPTPAAPAQPGPGGGPPAEAAAPPAAALPVLPMVQMTRPQIATSAKEAQDRPELVAWKFGSVKPPAVALSANSDGTNTARVNLTMEWTRVPIWDPADPPSVEGISLAPTFAATDNSKKGLFSIGNTGTSSLGVTNLSGGFMFAYTRYAKVRPEEIDLMTGVTSKVLVTMEDITACDVECKDQNTDTNNNCATYHVARPQYGENISAMDYAKLCTTRKKLFKQRLDAAVAEDPTYQRVIERRKMRARFPVLDLSIWGGGGASQFNFYELEPVMTGVAPMTYAASTQWQGSGTAALQLSSVPSLNRTTADGLPDPGGLTVEVSSYLRGGYQASSNTGTVCSTVGNVPPSSTLTQCSAAQPIGAPSSSTDLYGEVDVGWVDLKDNYGRFSLGVGVDRNFGTSLTTVSIKLPAYLNGTAAAAGAPAQNSKAASAPDGIKALSYDGIVRVAPTWTYVADPSGKKTGWGFGVAVDLIGNHNLFTRADQLVK